VNKQDAGVHEKDGRNLFCKTGFNSPPPGGVWADASLVSWKERWERLSMQTAMAQLLPPHR